MKRWTSRLLPWLLVLLNGLSPLLFRSTITLDGPMHVLHATVRPTAEPLPADAVGYAPPQRRSGLPDATRTLLAPLVQWLGPFHAHRAMLALVITLLGASVLVMAASTGMPRLHAVAWALPVIWGIPLLLGFFGFLLGVAVALLGTALWWRQEHIGTKAIALLLAFLLLAAMAHRSAPLLLLLFVGTTELAGLLAGDHDARMRWRSIVWRQVRWPLLAMLLIAMGYTFRLLYQGEAYEAFEPRDPWAQLMGMRPMLLFHQGREQPYLLCFGAGLLLLLWRAGRMRILHGPRFDVRDGLLMAALLLWMASFMLDSPKAQLYFLVERAQWLALLLSGLWALCFLRLRHAWWIAALLLGVHTLRTTYVERQMSGFEAQERSIRALAACLPPHGVVVPMGTHPHWIYMHQGAYLAGLHSGVLWTPVDHMRYRYGTAPHASIKAYTGKRATDWAWLEEHLARGLSPRVDVLLLWTPEGHWPDAHAEALARNWFTLHCEVDGVQVLVRQR